MKNPNHVIRDMVYYWPMYTDTNLVMSEPIMIFSRLYCFHQWRYIPCSNRVFVCSSKHEGLAGSRFGWGLYEDSELAQDVAMAVDIFTLGLSIDVELRIVTIIQAIIGI